MVFYRVKKNALNYVLGLCHISVCDSNMYGEDCSMLCGHCFKSEQCNHTNGTCMYGCASGYQGSICMKGKLYLVVAVESNCKDHVNLCNNWHTYFRCI